MNRRNPSGVVRSDALAAIHRAMRVLREEIELKNRIIMKLRKQRPMKKVNSLIHDFVIALPLVVSISDYNVSNVEKRKALILPEVRLLRPL